MTALLVALNYLKPKELDHLNKKDANGSMVLEDASTSQNTDIQKGISIFIILKNNIFFIFSK
jgi:hypothetical protein